MQLLVKSVEFSLHYKLVLSKKFSELKIFLSYFFVFHRCSCVCKSWNQILQQDKLASTMRRSHLSQVEAALEVRARLWLKVL